MGSGKGRRPPSSASRANASGEVDKLPGLSPTVVYLVLAPYIGAHDAREFVQGKVQQTGTHQDAGAPRLDIEASR
jgi:hypothetical protein